MGEAMSTRRAALFFLITLGACGDNALMGGGDATAPIDATVSVDLAMPDLAMPDLSQPDLAQPDLAMPDLAQPDLAQPDLAQPDLARPDSSQPDFAQPDLALPDLAKPDLAQPDLTAPVDMTPPFVTGGMFLHMSAAKATGTAPQPTGCGSNALTWTDLSSRASNGVLTNWTTAECSASPPMGWQGAGSCNDPYRLAFDGAGDYVKVVNNNGVMNTPNGITVEVWLNATSIGNQAVILSTLDPQLNGYYIQFYQGKLILATKGDTFEYGTTTLQPNKWYQLVASYDGSKRRFYINGQPDGVVADSAGLSATNGYLSIGNYITYTGSNAYPFTGAIADVKLYSRALTDSEVLTNFNAGNGVIACP